MTQSSQLSRLVQSLVKIKSTAQTPSLAQLEGQPISQKKKFHLTVPAESAIDRLISLGIEKRRIVPSQIKEASEKVRQFKDQGIRFEGRSRLIKRAAQISDCPKHPYAEIAFIGRSNVGKSSLLNLLVGAKVATESKTPGHTRSLDFYVVDDSLCFVDMPGYGFAMAPTEIIESWPQLIEDYIRKRCNLKRLYLLLDSRHGIKPNDASFIKKLEENEVYFTAVLTKCDLVNPNDLAKRMTQLEGQLEEFRFASKKILLSSTKIETLRIDLMKELTTQRFIPRGIRNSATPKKPVP